MALSVSLPYVILRLITTYSPRKIFIAAPRERVFEALTDPKQAARWWGAADRCHMAEFQMDVRVGGEWSTNGVSPKMGAINVHGELSKLIHLVASPTPGSRAGCRRTRRSFGNSNLKTMVRS